MKIDSGNTAWVLASAALVLFMTPGLALFYGGMVRAKNVLGMLMQNFFCMGLVSVLWAAVAYSLAFSGTGKYIGNFDLAWMRDVATTVPTGFTLSIPPLSFSSFQLMFAIITPALITGAIADRMKFSAWFWFLGLWLILVYTPVAHWVFSPAGWLFQRGALDFAGGTVVHINAGIAALAAVLVIGKRRGWPKHPMPPHSLPFTLLGTGILWFGWFGFNAGSALAADGIAAQAFINTNMAAAAAMLAGCCSSASRRVTPPPSAPRRARSPDWLRSHLVPVSWAAWRRSTSASSPASSASSPAASSSRSATTTRSTWWGCTSWVASSARCCWGCSPTWRTTPRARTECSTVGAGPSWASRPSPSRPRWSGRACSPCVILKVLQLVIPGGIRVSEEDEETGLDLTQHSEVGYSLDRV